MLQLQNATATGFIVFASPLVLFFKSILEFHHNFQSFISDTSQCRHDVLISRLNNDTSKYATHVSGCVSSSHVVADQQYSAISFRSNHDDYDVIDDDPCVLALDLRIIPNKSLDNAFGNDRLYCNRMVDAVFLQLLIDAEGLSFTPRKIQLTRFESIMSRSKASFFIYNLQEKYFDPIPFTSGGFDFDYQIDRPTKDALANERSNVLLNFGSGPMLSSTFQTYNTQMHSLFNHFLHRFRKSTLRSPSPRNSSFFFIPYDISKDVPFGNHFRHYPGCPLAPSVEEQISKTEQWLRYGGRDHVVVISTLPSNLLTHSRCARFLIRFCKFCIKVVIENTYTNCPPTSQLSSLALTWFTVPYPSTYHFAEDFNAFWLKLSYYRQYTTVFIGNSNTSSLISYRAFLERSCASMKNPHFCLWVPISSAENVSDTINLYRETTFCLMPTGHTNSRKALIDALISGCIPVVFHLCTLHYLMPEYVNISTALSISIYFPSALLADEHSESNASLLLSWLVAIRDSEEVTLKRNAIAKIARRLQYSHVSGDEPDAFDVFVKSILKIVSEKIGINQKIKQTAQLDTSLLLTLQVSVLVSTRVICRL